MCFNLLRVRVFVPFGVVYFHGTQNTMCTGIGNIHTKHGYSGEIELSRIHTVGDIAIRKC